MKIQEIATPVCALARNDMVFRYDEKPGRISPSRLGVDSAEPKIVMKL